MKENNINNPNNNSSNVNNSKEKLMIYRIVSIILVVAGFVTIFIGMSNFNVALFFVGGILLFIGWPLFGLSVISPVATKVSAHTQNVVLEENKEILTDVSSKGADIKVPAVTKYAKAIKEGLKEEQVYCKECGKSIDSTSKFCKFCGTKQ